MKAWMTIGKEKKPLTPLAKAWRSKKKKEETFEKLHKFEVLWLRGFRIDSARKNNVATCPAHMLAGEILSAF